MEHPLLKFTCAGCGSTLSIEPSKAGTSGPCPSCGTWISAPLPAKASATATASTDEKFPPRKSSPRSTGRAKGRIPADSIIDRAHLEQRESAKTLKVLALSILVVCVCLAAAWFLKDGMAK